MLKIFTSNRGLILIDGISHNTNAKVKYLKHFFFFFIRRIQNIQHLILYKVHQNNFTAVYSVMNYYYKILCVRKISIVQIMTI